MTQSDNPRLRTKNQPFFVMKQLKAMAAYDAGPRLGELSSIPSLVVAASEDRVAPARNGRALAAAIPGAKGVELAGAGHGVTIHRADDINRLLAEHFR